MFASEVWLKLPGYHQFLIDALIDTGSASSYILKALVPPSAIIPLPKKVPIYYANNKSSVMTHYCIIKIALGKAIFPIAVYIHDQQNCDLLIGNDVLLHLLPLTIHPNKQITFTFNH